MKPNSSGDRREEREDRQNANYFLIKVDFRRHASLQGEIEWLDREEKKIRYFRSFLELVSLLSEALEENGFPRADYELRGWREEDDRENLPSARN